MTRQIFQLRSRHLPFNRGPIITPTSCQLLIDSAIKEGVNLLRNAIWGAKRREKRNSRQNHKINAPHALTNKLRAAHSLLFGTLFRASATAIGHQSLRSLYLLLHPKLTNAKEERLDRRQTTARQRRLPTKEEKEKKVKEKQEGVQRESQKAKALFLSALTAVAPVAPLPNDLELEDARAQLKCGWQFIHGIRSIWNIYRRNFCYQMVRRCRHSGHYCWSWWWWQRRRRCRHRRKRDERHSHWWWWSDA